MSDIQNLIEALDRNTAAVIASNEGRDRAIAAAEKVTSAKAPTAAEKKAAEKAAADAAAKAAAAGGEAEKPAAAVAGKPTQESIDAAFAKLDQADAVYTRDDVASAIVAYGNVESEEEVAARKAKTAEILGKVGAKKLSEIPETKYKAVVKAMRDLIAAGNLVATDEGEASEPEDDEDNLLG